MGQYDRDRHISAEAVTGVFLEMEMNSPCCTTRCFNYASEEPANKSATVFLSLFFLNENHQSKRPDLVNYPHILSYKVEGFLVLSVGLQRRTGKEKEGENRWGSSCIRGTPAQQ